MSSTTYSIQVAAETSAGTGPYSAAIDAMTDDLLSVASSSSTTTSVNISWTVDDGIAEVKTDPLSVTLDSTSVTSMTVSWALAEELTATSYND
jgi:hypothetical protein